VHRALGPAYVPACHTVPRPLLDLPQGRRQRAAARPAAPPKKARSPARPPAQLVCRFVASRSGQRRPPARNQPRRPGQSRSRARTGAPRPGGPRRSSARRQAWSGPGPLERAGRLAGAPGWALAAGALAWALMLSLWAAGVTVGSFAVFMATVLSAAIATGVIGARVASGKEPLRAARAVIVVVLAASVPVVFDPHSGDVFNLPKYTLMVVGSLVLAGLWAISAAHERSAPAWRNGLQWLVGALVLWTAVTAFASVDVRVSLLGNYGSYDGLYAAAAFGVVMMTAAEAFDASDVRRVLYALTFAGGGVVVLYGLVQLHDVEVHGDTWDFINWHLGSFSNDIFSTFGNPNHLAGYLAMLLPAVVVLGVLSRRWLGRCTAAVFGVAVLVELIRTSARGAWVATIASLVVLAVMMWPELRKRPGVTLGSAAAVVAVAAAGMAVAGRRFLSHPLSTLFQSGGNSSEEQRLEIWSAALRIAGNHPLTGTGPDTFGIVYPRYESAAWVKGLGPNYLVNGAHDIFMNVLADQGPIGLAIFVALLAWAAMRAIGAWRRLRSAELSEGGSSEAANQRALVAVLSAAIVAYVVQAVFNVQQVGLSFCFWLLLGLLAALARSVGVPATMAPRALLATTATAPGGDGLGAQAGPTATGQRDKGPTAKGRKQALALRPRHPQEVPWLTLSVSAVVAAAVVLLSLGADAPYRADHDYWAAATSLEPSASASTPTLVGRQFFSDMASAVNLNPWEPTYPAYEASVLTSAAAHASTKAETVQDLDKARALLARSVADEPRWAPYPSSEADLDMELSQIQPATARADIAKALLLAEQAVHDSPRDSAYRSFLATVKAAERKAGHG